VFDLPTPQHPYGVRLVVAYDGTDFFGFQRQLSARTVQLELEKAAEKLAGHPVSVRGAGRTDAGVHALGQVVSFDAARLIPARGWRAGLNAHLPDDLRVQSAEACAPGYAPRFDAMGKHYRYLVQHGEVKNPLLRERAWQLGRPQPLNLAAVHSAAVQLVGRHDFRAFRASDDIRPNTVRTIERLDVVEGFLGDPTLLAFDVHGDAFMKNMVRIIVGTLIDVGRGRRKLADVPRMIGPGAERVMTGLTAPAHGLTLVHVRLGRIALSPRRERATPAVDDAPDE
jgi:tRNA pseudouridine38-40 synthase